MKNSDLAVRIGAALELMLVLFNLGLAFMWFISLVWVLVGLFWGLVGLGVLVEAGIAIFVLIRGYTPLAIVGPVLGLIASVCNFNLFGGMFEMVVLLVMIVAMVLRGQEDQAAAS